VPKIISKLPKLQRLILPKSIYYQDHNLSENILEEFENKDKPVEIGFSHEDDEDISCHFQLMWKSKPFNSAIGPANRSCSTYLCNVIVWIMGLLNSY